jgi:hypothetical protein
MQKVVGSSPIIRSQISPRPAPRHTVVVRRTLALLAFLLALGVVAGTASARPQVAAATCKAGFKPGVVGGKFTCLKAGQACSAKHRADYVRSGFVCQSGRLRKQVTPPAATIAKRPVTGPGSSRANPIPLGKPGVLGNGWTLAITGVNLAATNALLAADSANKPPLAAYEYVLVAISATYTGPGSSHLTPTTSLHAIGASNFAHSMSNSFCGQLPSPNLDLTNPLVFKGGTISGYAACWMVAKSDVASLELYYQPLLSNEQVWFALH